MYVCTGKGRGAKTLRVGFPDAMDQFLAKGATVGLCPGDAPSEPRGARGLTRTPHSIGGCQPAQSRLAAPFFFHSPVKQSRTRPGLLAVASRFAARRGPDATLQSIESITQDGE